MAAAVKPVHPRETSFVSILSGWAQQGVQSFFATQRILLDLVMRQNANVMHALRQQLSDPHHSPTAIMGEMAGEGINNFIEGQKVLLDLGKQVFAEQDRRQFHGVADPAEGDFPEVEFAHRGVDPLQAFAIRREMHGRADGCRRRHPD